MRSFTDTKERIWYVAINVASIKMLRASPLKIDLLDSVDTGILQRLADDPVTFVDMIYLLCKEQCEKAGVTDEDFGRGMGGNVLDSAMEVFLEELIDFFPLQKREPLRRLLDKSKDMMNRVINRALTALEDDSVQEAMMTRVDKEARKLVEELSSSGDTSTTSLE